MEVVMWLFRNRSRATHPVRADRLARGMVLSSDNPALGVAWCGEKISHVSAGVEGCELTIGVASRWRRGEWTLSPDQSVNVVGDRPNGTAGHVTVNACTKIQFPSEED
jgi:hypothetical protein